MAIKRVGLPDTFDCHAFLRMLAMTQEHVIASEPIGRARQPTVSSIQRMLIASAMLRNDEKGTCKNIHCHVERSETSHHCAQARNRRAQNPKKEQKLLGNLQKEREK